MANNDGLIVASSMTLYQNHSGEGKLMSEDGEGAASSAVWAIALIIIVAMIVGAMYYSGFLGSKKKTEIDVNISAPTR